MGAGYIVFAHGSRVESANQAVRDIAAELARAGGFAHVEAAFLDLGAPDLAGAIAHLAAAGAERVIVIPYFLTLGLHADRDLPALVDSICLQHNGLAVTITPPLEGHPALLKIVLDRALEASNQETEVRRQKSEGEEIILDRALEGAADILTPDS